MSDDKFRKVVDPAGRLNELRTGRGTSSGIGEAMAKEGPEGDQDAFSTLSVDSLQKVMLELRFKKGNAKALAYSFLVEIDIDPSKEIVMDFTGSVVRIEGRNLWPLFSQLAAQRVAMVPEVDDLYAEAEGKNDKTVVTKITVEKKDY